MDSERYARLQQVFAQAHDLPPQKREQYLASACSDDEPMRVEVEELLEAADESSGDALDRALADDEAFELGRLDSSPKTIGPYKILGICGTGGMGTVFEAQQDSPLRRVAIKVIHSALPRPELLRRFRRESEILERLQHQNIAQIFEASEFEQDGLLRPFIAMEFVDGAPLLEFASKHSLNVAARLDIFVRICDAIHYAHCQGVVHRDLKPDNILVVESSSTEAKATRSRANSAEPKILDFGVARLADSDLQMTLATGAGQLLGSVPYMSPEQAAGTPDQIDPRSDVYSLGVVLFELLTGRLPQDLRHCALADALHAIRHDEPSRLGSADPGLRGDLDTIVGKCLEKDRERRYESVASLVEDLRLYQERKPVSAKPPSTWYQVKKFAQRNRVLVGGVATTALAIVAGAIIAVLLALNATQHADHAREAQTRSESSADRANLGAASALFDSDPAYARRLLDEVPEARRGWEWKLLSSTLSGFLLEFGQVLRRTNENFHNLPPGEDMHLLANGEEVVALSADDEFRVWRTRTGEVARSFPAPEDVRVFAASREGNLLAAGLASGRVVTCDPRDGKPVWTIWFESDARINAVAVAPAGDRIAIDLPGEFRFGTPSAWKVFETGDRNHFMPPALEFSRDGTQLARQFIDVLLFEVATGKVIGKPMNSEQVNWSLAIAPDKLRIAIGQMRRELRLYDPATGRLEFELLGHSGPITDIAYADGNRLLSASTFDGTIRVWDLERREQIAIIDAPNTTRAEFIDDDHILSLTDGRFRLWTLRDRRARELVAHDEHVFATVFSTDGKLLVSSAPWGDMIVWDALEGRPLFRAKAHLCDKFAFDRAGESIIIGPDLAQAWIGGKATPLDAPARPRLHHSRHNKSSELRVQESAVPFELQDLQIYRTQHGLLLDRGQQDGGLADRRLADRRLADNGLTRIFVDGVERKLPRPQVTADLGPHPQLVLGTSPGVIFEGAIAELIVFRGRLSQSDATAVDAYLSARRRGASAELPALDGLLAQFRADEQTVERSEDQSVQCWTATNDPKLVLAGRGAPRSSISFVPATEDQPAYVRFEEGYSVYRWLEMPIPQASSAESITLCWLGRYIAQGAQAGKVIRTAYKIETLDLPWRDLDARVTKTGAGHSRSPDGRYDALTIPDPKMGGSVIVRERTTGHCVAQFEKAGRHYFGVSFHPDSRRLACGTTDGTIDIFDVETQELVKRIEAHSSQCFDVAFSPDGKILASAGNDNALRLWDAETYELRLELPGHRSYVRCLNWSVDGSMLVSGSGDYGVRIWDATPRSERYAQLLANRELEREVRAQVLKLRASMDGDREAVAEEIRRRFGSDPARRRAAMKVLAQEK